MSENKVANVSPSLPTTGDFLKGVAKDGMWRSVGDNTVSTTKNIISNVLKNKGADDGTLQFVGHMLDSKEGEALVAGILCGLLFFGPQYIPAIPDQIKTDSRIQRLAQEFGEKAFSDGMSIITKELMDVAGPIFSQLMSDLSSLPEVKTRVDEQEEASKTESIHIEDVKDEISKKMQE
jgi:hypothetical protein